MKKDLKNFKKAAPDAPIGKEELEKVVKENMKKSEGELLSDLKNAVAQGKQDGSFNDEAVKEFVNKVSPMLSEAQRKKMKMLINQIK